MCMKWYWEYKRDQFSDEGIIIYPFTIRNETKSAREIVAESNPFSLDKFLKASESAKVWTRHDLH